MMLTISRRAAPFLVVGLLAIAPAASSQPKPGAIAYTISMPQPSNHHFHVTVRADGLKGELHDIKMPAWHPGYYRMIDYAKNVSELPRAGRAGPRVTLGEGHEEHVACRGRRGARPRSEL